jgi:hypothetical protein
MVDICVHLWFLIFFGGIQERLNCIGENALICVKFENSAHKCLNTVKSTGWRKKKLGIKFRLVPPVIRILHWKTK